MPIANLTAPNDPWISLPFVDNVSEILKVRLGEYDVSTTAEPLRHEEFNISNIVVHPGFNNSTLVHDIALLRLEKPAKRKQVTRLDEWLERKSLKMSLAIKRRSNVQNSPLLNIEVLSLPNIAPIRAALIEQN